ncbi:MAG: hypothetical protein H0V60_03205 [Actinobacteria bacterium]|nr:hypothetical protein [Actinomycetota bacterium]
MSLRVAAAARAIAILSLLAGAALLPAAAEGATAAPGDRGSAVRASPARVAIQELLDRRSTAVATRDRQAFLSTIEDSSPAFVRRQRRLFDAMGGIDFDGYELRARWGRYGDLVRPSDRRRYPGASSVSIPLTEERYRIAGFDAEDAAEDLFYTFVERDGRWLIAEDTDLDDIALFSARHLWDQGRLTSESSEHFLQLEHPCDGSDCLELSGDFLALAERGVARVEAYWDGPWRKNTLVLVPGSTKELARMLQATIDLDNFVAFAYSTVDVENSFDYTGHRILLNPKAFQVESEDQVFTILAHELLHIATRDAAGPFMPVFVDEGFAEITAYDGDPEALAFFVAEQAAGNFDGKLPKDFEFNTGEGTDIYMSYQEAQSAVKFFTDEWGLATFNDFYRTLGAVDLAPGTTRYHLDRALNESTGLGYAEFQKQWASSINGL